jgi:hypothetical protein
VGYNITDKIETGISAYYYSNEQESNTFQSTTTVSWKTTDWASDPSFTAEGKSAAFQNRAFAWPEDTRLTVSPYLKAEFGDLSIRMNVFYIKQRNNLEAWANQSETLMMFPPTAYPMATYRNEWLNPFTRNVVWVLPCNVQTCGLEQIVPPGTLSLRGTCKAGGGDRWRGHKPISGPFSERESTNRRISARSTLPLALEDGMKFKTVVGDVFVTAGLSYDAQDITKMKVRSSDAATLNQMVDASMPMRIPCSGGPAIH